MLHLCIGMYVCVCVWDVVVCVCMGCVAFSLRFSFFFSFAVAFLLCVLRLLLRCCLLLLLCGGFWHCFTFHVFNIHSVYQCGRFSIALACAAAFR